MNLTETQNDALKELFNIGIGRAAASLNELLEKKVRLEIPEVMIVDIEQAAESVGISHETNISSVEQEYTCSFSGKAALMFPSQDAAKLVSILSGEELGSIDLDSVKEGTLNEVGNILINGLLGSISNALGETMNYSLPIYEERNINSLFEKEKGAGHDMMILCKAQFVVEELEVEGYFIMYIGIKAIDVLLSIIDKQYGE